VTRKSGLPRVVNVYQSQSQALGVEIECERRPTVRATSKSKRTKLTDKSETESCKRSQYTPLHSHTYNSSTT